jgi:CubicO group peptidase (beta-lactamase class C family)
MTSFDKGRQVLAIGVEQRAFPGAAFAVWNDGATVATGSVGRFTYASDSAEMQPDTIFDIASVTKVLATTALAMRLWQSEELPLELPVCELLPEFSQGDPNKYLVTLKMLLAHTSGLPAHRKLYELPEVVAASSPEASAAAALSACFAMPLEVAPGARAEYSDIGFIVLGEALLRLTGAANLQEICAKEIFEPLGLTESCYLPPTNWRPRIAPTRDWNWRHCVLQGEVQDENCALLGSVSGHAGVFSSGSDLLRFAASLCEADGFFQRETVDLFSKRVAGSRALGWDSPSAPSQSGKFFSAHSIGHLGYTGTSLWIDLERGIAIALLTNRVYTAVGAANQGIQQVRPEFHDAVMTALGISADRR